MKSLLLPILIVVLVLGGITLDYTHHGANTWISHVLFWPALAYVALVVFQSFRGGSNRATLLLLPLLAAAASCQQTPARLTTAQVVAPDTVRAAYIVAGDTPKWEVETVQEGPYDVTRPVKW